MTEASRTTRSCSSRSDRSLGAPIRVLLVEDNDAFRDTIAFLLGRAPDLTVVGEVSDGSSAADACAEQRADVAVVDYRLPDVSGAVAAAEIRERCPWAAVVFLSAFAGGEELEAARIAGVTLVRKDQGVDALAEAIRAAAQGGGTYGTDV
jgi:DNA-binding NarL/FixJ family response regulator